MSNAASPWIFDVAEADFQRLVIDASAQKPVLVDFWAPWCQPCLMLGPLLEQIVNERQGELLLARVNVDEAQRLAQAVGVSAIPDLKIIRDGQIVREVRGYLPEPQLRAWLEEVLPTATDRLVNRVQDLEQTNPTEAERLYREALAQDPGHEHARIGLARVLLDRHRLDEIEEVLAPLSTEGELGAEAQRIKALAFLRRVDGRQKAALRQRLEAGPENAQLRLEYGIVLAGAGEYPEALEMLLSAGERDFKLAGGPVRETMVQVFYALGSGHALANEYRAKLARLLY
jgi:putative thioredoxin